MHRQLLVIWKQTRWLVAVGKKRVCVASGSSSVVGTCLQALLKDKHEVLILVLDLDSEVFVLDRSSSAVCLVVFSYE